MTMNVEDEMQKAKDYIQDNELDDAIRVLNRINTSHPRTLEVWN